MIVQHYTDNEGGVSTFEDGRENYCSQKCKPEHITVLSGSASPAEIAEDINRKPEANHEHIPTVKV